MNSIYTIGEVLVEMMASNIGQGFTHPGVWHGPYPSDAQGVIDWFLQNGIREVVVKRGREGASYFSAAQTLHVPGYPVIEVDPTGAGDYFGGAFIACRQRRFQYQPVAVL